MSTQKASLTQIAGREDAREHFSILTHKGMDSLGAQTYWAGEQRNVNNSICSYRPGLP